jgi:thymidylate kinase
MARKFAFRKDFVFNEGPVYPNVLTARLAMVANQANEREREFLYTMFFMQDFFEASSKSSDNRFVFQDRYWPSVISYGRFLNGQNSIHLASDFRPFFIQPVAVIYFSCSLQEKIKRSNQRGRKSTIDKILLENPDQFKRLEIEIDRSLEALPNVFQIDTSERTIQETATKIEEYLKSRRIAF